MGESEEQTALALAPLLPAAIEMTAQGDRPRHGSFRLIRPHLLNAICVVTTGAIIVLLSMAGGRYGAFPDRWMSVATVGAVFVGSVVAGFAGFAFSAVAGGMLLHWLAPPLAVPLLLSCSVTTQLVSLARLWQTIAWRQCLRFVVGGLIGILIGAFILETISARAFDLVFGGVLVVYSGCALIWTRALIKRPARLFDVMVGFCGAITGGSTAFPGAFPTIWCNACGIENTAQRGIVQPFILVTQIATLAYFYKLGLLAPSTATIYFWCAPVVLTGTWLGLHCFRLASETVFRRVVLTLLLVSGVSLIL